MSKRKKKKKDSNLHITITIAQEEAEEVYYEPVADTFIYHFIKTLHYWVVGAIFFVVIGGILSLLG